MISFPQPLIPVASSGHTCPQSALTGFPQLGARHNQRQRRATFHRSQLEIFCIWTVSRSILCARAQGMVSRRAALAPLISAERCHSQRGALLLLSARSAVRFPAGSCCFSAGLLLRRAFPQTMRLPARRCHYQRPASLWFSAMSAIFLTVASPQRALLLSPRARLISALLLRTALPRLPHGAATFPQRVVGFSAGRSCFSAISAIILSAERYCFSAGRYHTQRGALLLIRRAPLGSPQRALHVRNEPCKVSRRLFATLAPHGSVRLTIR